MKGQACLVIPYFCLSFDVFFCVLQTRLGFPHPLALSLTHCIYDQLLDPMQIHLFRYAHGGEKTTSHDVIWDAFASITRDVGFHVLWEQTHILPPPYLQSSLRRVNIVLLIDGTRMLANVIIIDPIQAYLVSQVTLFHGCGYDTSSSCEGSILQ